MNYLRSNQIVLLVSLTVLMGLMISVPVHADPDPPMPPIGSNPPPPGPVGPSIPFIFNHVDGDQIINTGTFSMDMPGINS